MKVIIKNLGNVESGEIDLSKRLTVFCGPNNTGKTYVSYILYSLIKTQYYYDDRSNLDLSKVFTEGEVSIEIDLDNLIKYRKNKIHSITNSLESIFGISDSDKLSLFKSLELKYGVSDREFSNSIKDIQLNFSFEWSEMSFIVKKEKGSTLVIVKRSDAIASVPEDDYFFSWRLKYEVYERLVNYPFAKSCIFPVERNSIYTFNK